MIYANFLNFLHLAQATPAASSASSGASSLSGILVPMLCFGAIFYFLLIRPQSQKQKQQQTLISSLKTGDKVVTSGGMHGLVANVKDSTVLVKVADNVKIEVDKSAIVTVTKRTEDDPAPAS